MAAFRFRARLLGLLVLLVVFALDQWSKAAIVRLEQMASIPREIAPFFNIVRVQNYGISFGFFAHGQAWVPLALIALTSCMALALCILLLRARETLPALALGSILGGALGNICDRMRVGAVTDFLDFHIGHYHWPAFNLADSAIFIGVVILVLISIVGPSTKQEEARP